MYFSSKLSLNWAFCGLWKPKMTRYGLHNINNQKYYGLEPFRGVWALKMHYLGQYCQFCLFPWISALNSAQIGPFEGSDHRKWLDMTFITFIIGNTMDWNRFEKFEDIKCIIWVNIANFVTFPWISALNSPQIWPIEGSAHRKLLDVALITIIIGNTLCWYRFEEFGHLRRFIWVNIVNFAFFHVFRP